MQKNIKYAIDQLPNVSNYTGSGKGDDYFFYGYFEVTRQFTITPNLQSYDWNFPENSIIFSEKTGATINIYLYNPTKTKEKLLKNNTDLFEDYGIVPLTYMQKNPNVFLRRILKNTIPKNKKYVESVIKKYSI